MPLSPDISQACINACQSLAPDVQAISNSNKERDHDLSYFHTFFKQSVEQCHDDKDFIKKLFEAAYDYYLEKRIIDPSSVNVINIIAAFNIQIQSHPYHPIIHDSFNKIINSGTSLTFNMDAYVKQCIEKYKVVINSYLNGLLVIPASLTSSFHKYTSNFAHAFSNSGKIVKLETNPKILFMKHLNFDLDLLLLSGKYILYNNEKFKIYPIPNGASKDTVLTIIQQLLENREQYYRIAATSGHFFTMVRLIKSDINSELSTGKTLGPCPQATYTQISQILSEQFAKEKKSIQTFEPSHLVNSNASSSSKLFEAFTQPPQTFGGGDQNLVITSIRQMINPELPRIYEEKKKNLSLKQNTRCTDLEPLAIEQSLLTFDPKVNEALLIHGTSPEASSHIFHRGYRKPEAFSYLNVVGSLGPGIYMSDNFVKSGTFATCMLCGRVNCECKIYPEQKVSRCVIITQVAMGHTLTTPTKIRRIPDNFDSAVGIGKHINKNSDFNSTEVCVKTSEQTLPLFEVKYFTYENMCLLEKWPDNVTELQNLKKLIHTLLNDRAENWPMNATHIKKECEYLLTAPLMHEIKTKVVKLIDQINIEESQENKSNPH